MHICLWYVIISWIIHYSDIVVEIKCPVNKTLPKYPKPYYIGQMYTQAAAYKKVNHRI